MSKGSLRHIGKILPSWLEPWRKIIVINLMFLAILACIGVAYFLFVRLSFGSVNPMPLSRY